MTYLNAPCELIDGGWMTRLGWRIRCRLIEMVIGKVSVIANVSIAGVVVTHSDSVLVNGTTRINAMGARYGMVARPNNDPDAAEREAVRMMEARP